MIMSRQKRGRCKLKNLKIPKNILPQITPFFFRNLQRLKQKAHRSPSPSPSHDSRHDSSNQAAYYSPRDNNFEPNETYPDVPEVDYSPDARESDRSAFGSESPPAPFADEELDVSLNKHYSN